LATLPVNPTTLKIHKHLAAAPKQAKIIGINGQNKPLTHLGAKSSTALGVNSTQLISRDKNSLITQPVSGGSINSSAMMNSS